MCSNAPPEEKPKPAAEAEEREDSHQEKERPSASRTSKRAASVRSTESSDSGGGHRKSPLKPRKRKGGISPAVVQSQEETKVKVESESVKPAGPIK